MPDVVRNEHEAEKAQQAIQEVMNLHRPDGEGWCVEDGFTWPCSTARVISVVMDADPSERASTPALHEHDWQVEYLPDPMSAGSVVRSGDLFCACGETVPDNGTPPASTEVRDA